MNIVLQIFVVTGSLLFSLASFAQAESEDKKTASPEPISAKHAREIFQKSKYSSAKIDPSGQRVSFIEHDKTKDTLMFLDLKSNNMQAVFVDDDNRIKNYVWVDEDTIVASVRYLDFNRSLYKFDFVYENGLLKNIESKLILNNAYLIDALPSLTNKIAVAYYSEDEPDIYTFDLNAKNISSQLGGRHKLNKNAPDGDDWIFDTHGNLKVMSARKDGKITAWYKEPEKGRWIEIWNEKQATTFIPLSFNSDTEELLVLSNHDRNFTEVIRYNVHDKTFGETLFKIDNHDVESVQLNQKRDGILYASYQVNGVEQREYFSDLGSFIKQQLNKSIKASGFWVHDKSLDNSVVLALKRNSQQPGIYYLFETNQTRLSVLTETKPLLSKFRLGKNQTIKSKSSDGLEIESYLTLPADSDTVKPPLIVIPHGGPVNVRASSNYNATVQYLASLGYAVLRPNFRGSLGFGKKFKEAAKQQWGKLIEDDIDSATQAVIDSGLIDKHKICIYGASYGGYSALISGIRRPDMYKCSASLNGVSDINLMLSNHFESDKEDTLSWIKEYYGNPETNQQELLLKSPVYQADKFKTPVFLAHGLKDMVVDIEHFYRMKAELKRNGNPASSLILSNERHGLKYLNTNVELYSALDAFFRKSLDLPEAKVLVK
ncbi:alpha/beta hydrolase family protein [Pseudoteredinibacter isoporae]|uniref:alpha/beta hydrolase family protein n=1 Tax=Pseudoteredinibacter isoporae TaxID=570281 RepID=UPI003104556F